MGQPKRSTALSPSTVIGMGRISPLITPREMIEPPGERIKLEGTDTLVGGLYEKTYDRVSGCPVRGGARPPEPRRGRGYQGGIQFLQYLRQTRRPGYARFPEPERADRRPVLLPEHGLRRHPAGDPVFAAGNDV